MAQSSGAAAAPAQPAASTGMTNNVAGMLCYLFTIITGIIFLVLEPYNKNRFVRFHAFQAIFLGVAGIVFWMVWSMVFVSMIFTSGLGFIWMLTRLIQLAFFGLLAFMMYKAYNNEEFKLPIIGDLAAKQAGS